VSEKKKAIRDVHCGFRCDAVDLQVPDLNGKVWKFFFGNDLQHDMKTPSLQKPYGPVSA
jgi:hypothetical protein